MNLDGVRDHPDVNLAEAGFQCFLESPEKSVDSRRVLDIKDDFDVSVLEGFPALRPNSLQPFWTPRDSAEFSDQVSPRLGETLLLDRNAIVIPCGQENLVPFEGHRLD